MFVRILLIAAIMTTSYAYGTDCTDGKVKSASGCVKRCAAGKVVNPATGNCECPSKRVDSTSDCICGGTVTVPNPAPMPLTFSAPWTPTIDVDSDWSKRKAYCNY